MTKTAKTKTTKVSKVVNVDTLIKDEIIEKSDELKSLLVDDIATNGVDGMDVSITSNDDAFGEINHQPLCNPVQVFATSEFSELPHYATGRAACFDLTACIKGRTVKMYNRRNKVSKIEVDEILTVKAHSRALVPTGLIFDIPEGQSMRLLPRSGLALKQGITLTNCMGVIDEDFIHETHVILENNTDNAFIVAHGDRIVQAEFYKSLPQSSFMFMDVAPEPKSDRNGGFGHTGVK